MNTNHWEKILCIIHTLVLIIVGNVTHDFDTKRIILNVFSIMKSVC